ncbi:DgyrCDS14956 [Dimorphilus gyrociliatus]|uniref:DgyrCDS14956 n=1 Tax=Dimorphilus gyrociliatus TaxID=2664684 RepID=A0A7I8WFH8_9ANNE|nr:DgyrCDS14956 [Dimorphilus gyrociliatus]
MECINDKDICNAEPNCIDFSDEQCRQVLSEDLGLCQKGLHHCDNSKCLSEAEICNKYVKCEDFSDESQDNCIDLG